MNKPNNPAQNMNKLELKLNNLVKSFNEKAIAEIEKQGTIGDWLRKHVHEIREM